MQRKVLLDRGIKRFLMKYLNILQDILKKKTI